MMVSGTFSRLLAPGLQKVFHRSYNELPEGWTQIFNLNKSDRAYEDHFTWAGFEPFQNYGELEDIEIRNARPGYTVRYVHRKWGLGYQLSQELVDDNQYTGVIETFPAHLARSARATKETVAASILNLGWAPGQPGGDGQPLFSAVHPLFGNAGGTTSNTFVAITPLSHIALQQALVQLKRTLSDDQIFSPVTPKILLVPDQLEATAREILGTERMPYSADNTINTLRDSGLTIVSWSYLTSPTAWFLMAPKEQTGLHYFERWPMKQIMKDIEENQSMKHLAYERYSFGFSDHVGTFGVLGA
jgi:phage major head subunit gpT-like protein